MTVGLQADGVRADSAGVAGAVRRRRHPPVDRLRQRCESARRARGSESARDRGAVCRSEQPGCGFLRQCLVEGLILAVFGTVAGIATGWAALRLLLMLRPDQLSRLDSARVDATVLAVTIATAAGCGIMFSLAPLVELRRADPLHALQADGRRAGGSIHYRMRSALVLVQIAMSVVLLVGAALMLRSFGRLAASQPWLPALRGR
jgi:hypothetical protein